MRLQEKQGQVGIKIDRRTYQRLRSLAEATDRTIASTLRIIVLRARPEDVVWPVAQVDEPDMAARDHLTS